jgi:hypothetical protein
MTRGERRSRTVRIVRRRARQARALATFSTPVGGRLLGRWRRHAPLDCGRPRCGLCTSAPRRDERRAWRQRERRDLPAFPPDA